MENILEMNKKEFIEAVWVTLCFMGWGTIFIIGILFIIYKLGLK
jgi:hypothetical protein